MDPNRYTPETILNLPTPRLLNHYKKIRYYPRYYDDTASPWYIYHKAMEKSIKQELDKREHVNKNKKR